MTVFDDLEAEQDRLADILAGLSGAQWVTPSLAPGWTVRDVVVHLAQGEELVVARLGGTPHPAAPDPAADQEDQEDQGGRTVEQIMAGLVEADPATPAQALGPPDAASAITGDAGLFCRVAAQRLTPAQAAGATGAGLQTSGPDGARALALVRSYAV